MKTVACNSVVGSTPMLGAILDRGRKSIKFKTLVDDPILD